MESEIVSAGGLLVRLGYLRLCSKLLFTGERLVRRIKE